MSNCQAQVLKMYKSSILTLREVIILRHGNTPHPGDTRARITWLAYIITNVYQTEPRRAGGTRVP